MLFLNVPSFFDTPESVLNELWNVPLEILSVPKIDILDKTDSYEVRVEIPGLSKENVEVLLR
jgi:HSP20 family molecular chaperone IbpA